MDDALRKGINEFDVKRKKQLEADIKKKTEVITTDDSDQQKFKKERKALLQINEMKIRYWEILIVTQKKILEIEREIRETEKKLSAFN